MTSARASTMPAAIFDTRLPTSTRRALLEKWWTRARRAACRPRPMAMRVYADGAWWSSSPSRPTLAPVLLAAACRPKVPSPSPISAAEEAARESWAETMSEAVDVFGREVEHAVAAP